MRSHTRVIPSAAATLLIMGCQGPSPSVGESSLAESANDDSFATDRTATLWVKGLACPYCVHNVDRQLAALPGVERVHVDLSTGKVRVALAAEQPATRDVLVKAIDDSGFTLDWIEMPQ